MSPRTSLGVDFGTSHTIAVVRRADGSVRPLLFDGAPLMPSAVCADAEGGLLVGRDAVHAGRRHPERFEPNPKRLIDRPSTLLGEREFAVPELIAAVLDAVSAEARRVIGAPEQVTLTVPAEWGPARRKVVEDAATRSGLGPKVRLVPEPVAAATYYAEALKHRMAIGSSIVVYDLGAGTFDASVVRRDGNGFTTVALDGRGDLGGLDIDAALIDHLGTTYGSREGWKNLVNPTTIEERRHFREFQEEVRSAKERLSRHQQSDIAIPLLNLEAHLTRSELERLAEPHLEQTIRVTQAVIAAAGLDLAQSAGVFLVGGASRMPLVATMLHRALGIAPTVLDQPEVVVAEGSVLWTQADTTTLPLPPHTPAAPPAPVQAAPTPQLPPASPPYTSPARTAPHPVYQAPHTEPVHRDLPPQRAETLPLSPPQSPPRPQTEAERQRAKRFGRRFLVAFIMVDVLIIAGLVWYFGRPDEDQQPPQNTSGEFELDLPDAELGELVQSFPAHDGAVVSLTSIETDAGPELFSAGSDRKVYRWSADSEDPVDDYDFEDGIRSLWSVDWGGAETVVVVDSTYRPHLLDPESQEFLAPGEPVMPADVEPQRVAVGSWDGEPVLGLISESEWEFFQITTGLSTGVVDLPSGLGWANFFFADGGVGLSGIDNENQMTVLWPVFMLTEGGTGGGVSFTSDATAPDAVPEGDSPNAVSIVYDDGAPYAMVRTTYGELRVWDLNTLDFQDAGLAGLMPSDHVCAEIVTTDRGEALLYIGEGGTGYVYIVEVDERIELGDDTTGPMTKQARVVAGGRDFAVTGDANGNIQIWSLGQ
ncbi:Hsp70 family protein [Glycomyces sp. NPDC046736]|uniref:Hsp70 family protein n=1 Tax=Glycomyces sp. NPDC046736 TaxID=3155615 RepID=UPI0033EC0421